MLRFVPILFLAFSLTGCGLFSRDTSSAAASPQRMIRVDWYGYQCFRIKSALGISVLTNPFSAGSTSFSVPEGLTPEILLVTNEDSDVNNIDLVDNSPSIYRGSVGMGTNTSAGVRILGVPVFTNPDVQDIAGMNVVYRWQMDGLKFCFLGEIDSALSKADASKIGAVDVLFLPVSGTKLTSGERADIVERLRPRVIIPMGSATAVRSYASGFTSVYPLNGNAALLSREALPAQQTVLLFKAP
ncbi:MAG: MBL fold metallo-hydrolase [Chthoniobacterales bacterium]